MYNKIDVFDCKQIRHAVFLFITKSKLINVDVLTQLKVLHCRECTIQPLLNDRVNSMLEFVYAPTTPYIYLFDNVFSIHQYPKLINVTAKASTIKWYDNAHLDRLCVCSFGNFRAIYSKDAYSYYDVINNDVLASWSSITHVFFGYQFRLLVYILMLSLHRLDINDNLRYMIVEKYVKQYFNTHNTHALPQAGVFGVEFC
jgi:hypothetical protein